MPDLADSIDITTDLNGQSPDAKPYHGNDVPANQQPAKTPEPAESTDGEGEKPSKSLRDTLSDAFKGTEPPKVEQPAKPADKAPDGVGEGPELVKVGERYHRKDGSFASKDEIDAYNRVQAPDAPPAMPQWANGLTELEKQQFASLPAETRQFVERTMEGVNTRGAQLDEYGTLEQVIGPRRQAWSQQGMTPLVALNSLFSLSDFAGRDPGQFVLWFADQHKLNLDQLLDARDAAVNGQQSNPQLAGLQQEIAQLRNVINGFSDHTVQSRQANSLQTVQAFQQEKDEHGNMLYPYFDALVDDIANHVAIIRQQQPLLPEHDVLKAAYDFAAYNNSTVRGEMQQKQAKAFQEAQAAEAARARKVGVSINGGPAGDAGKQPNNANRTLRETLLDAYNQSVNE